MKKDKKSLTKNSLFYLIYNILNVFFPFFTGMYVAHILIPESIGQIEAARNFVQYFVIFSFLGIPTYGIREVSKVKNNKEKLNRLYTELMLINFISTVFFMCIYIIIVVSLYRENLILYLIVGSAISLNILNNGWLYEGLEEFKFISLRNIIFKIISFILLIVFVRESEDYLIYAFITVFGTAGNYIMNVIFSRKFIKISFKNINLKRHLNSIIYLVVVNLAIEIYTLVDVTMLNFFSEDKMVAYYSYGVKIYKILLQIINTFTMVLLPKIVVAYQEKRVDDFNKLLRKTLLVILILSIPMVTGIIFTSDYLITLIYGHQYIYSSYVLKILSFILIISPVGYLLGSRVLLVTGNERKMVIPVAIGAVINITLNSIFIPKYNGIGAAIASLVSELSVMMVYVFLSNKLINISKINKDIIKILISIFFMCMYLISVKVLIKNDFIKTMIQIIGSMFIYFIILYMLKEEFLYSFVNEKILKRKVKNG